MQRAALGEPSSAEVLKAGLAEANRKLAEQTEIAAAVKREKEISESHLKQLSNDKTIHALRSENEALKKQLIAKTPRPKSVVRSDQTEKEFTEVKATLQSMQK